MGSLEAPDILKIVFSKVAWILKTKYFQRYTVHINTSIILYVAVLH